MLTPVPVTFIHGPMIFLIFPILYDVSGIVDQSDIANDLILFIDCDLHFIAQ